MADKQISQLVEAKVINNADLFVLEQTGAAKKLSGFTLIQNLAAALDGHGGINSINKVSTSGLNDTYEITYADGSTTQYTITNGRGIQSFAKSTTVGLTDHYLVTFTDGTRLDIPVQNGREITNISLAGWNDTTETFKVDYNDSSFNTFNVRRGNFVKSFAKTSTDGLTDTYTFTYTDDTTSTLSVDNGKGVESLIKTATEGLTDTYTFTYNDGTSNTFSVDNGRGVESLEKTSSTGLTDNYTFTYNDGTASTFSVDNGRGIAAHNKAGSVGLEDNYEFVYNDGTTSQYTVTNGRGVSSFSATKINEKTTQCVLNYNDGSSSIFSVDDGDKGDAEFLWIRYATERPTRDDQMLTEPNAWIGICKSAENVAPTSYSRYTWYRIKGDTGNTGATPRVLNPNESVKYLASDSGTVIPEGSWTTTIPSVAQGRYLWTRTRLEWSTGGTVDAYSVARNGLDGSGSVSSVNNVAPDPNGNVQLTTSSIPNDSGYITAEQVDTGIAGARNLLLNTYFDPSHDYDTTGTENITLSDGTAIFSSDSNIDSSIQLDVSNYFFDRVRSGDTLGFSFDYNLSVASHEDDAMCGLQVSIVYSDENEESRTYTPAAVTTNGWQRFTVNETLSEGHGTISEFAVSLWVYGISGTAQIKSVKLETGSKCSDWSYAPEDVVSKNTTINGHKLEENIDLIPDDIGAVPTTRTVNGKSLANDITLNASDVGARPSTWTPTASDVGAYPTTGGKVSGNVGVNKDDYNDANTGVFLGNNGYLGIRRNTADGDFAYLFKQDKTVFTKLNMPNITASNTITFPSETGTLVTDKTVGFGTYLNAGNNTNTPDFFKRGISIGSIGGSSTYPFLYGSILTVNPTEGNGRGLQLLTDYTNRIMTRVANTNGGWTDWAEIIKEGNPTTHDVQFNGSLRGKTFTGASSAGKVTIVPYYRYTDLGLTAQNTTIEAFFEKWLIAVCSNYALTNTTFIGTANPSTNGTIEAYILDTTTKNAAGLPQYSSGTYTAYNGMWIFRTYDYVFSAIQISTFASAPASLANISGVYSASVTYTAGSYCTYNGTLYKCKQQCSNVVPTNTTYWEATTIANALTKKNRANSNISFGVDYVAKNDLYLRVYSPYTPATNNGYFMFYVNGELIECWRPDTQNSISHSIFIRQGLTYKVSKNDGVASVNASATIIEVY